MIGLDTSAIVDIFRGNENIKKFLEANKEPLAGTIVNYLELSFGLEPENLRHERERRYYDELFDLLYIFN